MLYHTRYSAPGGRGGRMVLTGQRYVFQQLDQGCVAGRRDPLLAEAVDGYRAKRPPGFLMTSRSGYISTWTCVPRAAADRSRWTRAARTTTC
jgi:hypothetical protein